MRRLLFLVVLVALALWGWHEAHQAPIIPVQGAGSSDAAVAQKTAAFAAAAVRARLTGRPVAVSQDFSDADLTLLANQQALAKGLPVDQIALHATGRGVIEGDGRATVGGQPFPIAFEGVPQIGDGDHLELRLTSLKVGAIPVPASVAAQLGLSDRTLTVGPPLAGFQDVRLQPGDGRLTVSAVARPA